MDNKTMYELVILLVGVFLSLQVNGAPRKFETIEDLPQLKYGQPCSYEIEELRQNLSATIISATKNTDSPAHLSKLIILVKQIQKEILGKGQGLCNAMELVTCSKKTSTCDCGDPIIFAVTGDESEAKSKIISEDENKCRWAPNSYCASVDYLKNNLGGKLTIDSKCARETECVSTETRDLCTIGTYVNYAQRISGSGKYFVDEVYSGAVCSCQHKTTENDEVSIVKLGGSSHESNVENDYQRYQYSVGDSENNKRRKRGVILHPDMSSILPMLGGGLLSLSGM